jgi:hypothetical protein
MANKYLATLANVVHQWLRDLLATRCTTSVALAIGTTKSKLTTGAAAQYCIGGVAYTKAATADLFTHTDTTVQAADTTKFYLCTLDASGNGLITQGTSTALPEIARSAGEVPVGYIKVVTDGVTFTPGTTLHDAAGVTTTYVNLQVMPESVS